MIKSNSRTNNNLKAIRLFNGYPRFARAFINLKSLMVIGALALLVLMVNLGFWQLDRANEKQVIQQALTQRLAQASLSYEQLRQLPPTNLTGYRLKLYATPQQSPLILLDNQTHNGVIGYLAYQVIKAGPTAPSLLLELGFVPAPVRRSELPQVERLQQPLSLSGRVYQKSANPMSYQLFAEPGNPTRIQNLNITELSQHLGIELFPAVLQVTDLDNGLEHPWIPLPMSASKHQGYAFQWFSMALALAILLLVFYRKHTLGTSKGQHNTSDTTSYSEPRSHDE